MNHPWRNTYEEIKQKFEDKGLILLSKKEDYKNEESILEFKDKEDYLYRQMVKSTKNCFKGGGFPKPFICFNYFRPNNVQLFLDRNNINWTVLTTNLESMESPRNLNFRCNVCGNDFERNVVVLIQTKRGCPYCTSKKVSEKNCIAYKYPDLVKYFNLEKNYPNTPNNVFASGGKEYWWKCNKCGYEWYDSVNHRTKNGRVRQCRSCISEMANDKNRLFVIYPKVKNEWDFEKNKINPNDLSYGSNLNAWWICQDCGNKFEQNIAIRVKSIKGCPKCNRNVLKDNNRLSILYPNISNEWNYEKNKDITPNLISTGSGKKYWWICPDCGSDYKCSAYDRVHGRDCTICSNSLGESKIRKYFERNNIEFYHHKSFSDCKYINLLTFDFGIYIKGILNLIEYNGQQHYKSIPFFGGQKTFEYQQVRDNIKKEYCKNNNIPLLEIPYWEFDNIEKILNNYLNIGENSSMEG